MTKNARSAMKRAEPARVRYVYLDCSLKKKGETLEWCHLVAESNVAESIQIVESSYPGIKARVRR